MKTALARVAGRYLRRHNVPVGSIYDAGDGVTVRIGTRRAERCLLGCLAGLERRLSRTVVAARLRPGTHIVRVRRWDGRY